MFEVIRARARQRYRTIAYPDGPPPALPERFRGRPTIDATKCPDGCARCAEACPTRAIEIADGPRIDLGRCLFCTDCADACPQGALRYGDDYRLAVREREQLIALPGRELELAAALQGRLRKLFGRSLKLRQVSAGGCNACELDVNVLNTVGWDLSRFGIQFVASPRHADGLLVTGAVSRNMQLALRKTYDAVPAPKLVIAVGACAISGGPYVDHPEVANGVEGSLPIDLYIAGCPPHPLTILDGLLRLVGRLEGRRESPGAHSPGAASASG
ncbi:MAG TPA: NADH-quinone oxidoreductase subunit NuoB [Myxococcota bacterium]|nr:NADH-quinone oxidoreductase subunit NuoB [Myxococcota bacterium]